MDREQVIALARQVWGQTAILPIAELERFAALVAAAEREACARVCEEEGLLWGQRYAAVIRSRT